MADLEQMIQERNKLLLEFFNYHLPLNIIRITGNSNSPVVVFQDEFIVNCYVKNFVVYFTDGKKNGKVIYKHKMSTSSPDRTGDHDEFMKWWNDYPMKRCYKVGIVNSSLFYTGHNYVDSEMESKNIYPVFAEYEPKIFYTKNYAENLIQELNGSELKLTQNLAVI